jgi:hypothetical protein
MSLTDVSPVQEMLDELLNSLHSGSSSGPWPLLLRILCHCSGSQFQLAEETPSPELSTGADYLEVCLASLFELCTDIAGNVIEVTAISRVSYVAELTVLIRAIIQVLQTATERLQRCVGRLMVGPVSSSRTQAPRNQGVKRLEACLTECKSRTVQTCTKLLKSEWGPRKFNTSHDPNSASILASKRMAAVCAGLPVPPSLKFSDAMTGKEIEFVLETLFSCSADEVSTLNMIYAEAIEPFSVNGVADDDSNSFATLNMSTFASYYNVTFQRLILGCSNIFDSFSKNVTKAKGHKKAIIVAEELDFTEVTAQLGSMVMMTLT